MNLIISACSFASVTEDIELVPVIVPPSIVLLLMETGMLREKSSSQCGRAELVQTAHLYRMGSVLGMLHWKYR